LLAIAAKVLSDRWQRSAKQQEVSTDDLELTGIEDNVEQRAMLYQLVQTLPDDQRRVIIWRFVGSVRPNV
jgi:DNA-directed RNA polymerase specialized sigma24 family protein